MAALIAMLLPILRRYQRDKLSAQVHLGNYDQLSAYCRTLFVGTNVEQCYLLCLDARLNLLNAVCLSRGTPGEVIVQPRAVVQELMRHSAMGAVLCHNHPSGSPQPSQADVQLTREIAGILDSLGLRLYDHVIVGRGEEYSFHAHQLL